MKKLGKQPRRHDFFLNPYRDWRASYCPKCEARTRLRKFPLAIHVEPRNPVVLNKSCRYCPPCDLIIAHQDEIETQLTIHFSEHDPTLAGNEYLIMGTLDRAVWRRSRKEPIPIGELMDQVHVFKQVLIFEPEHYGWVRE
jgi:thiol-disulfide isomerase/thioredoxin